MFLRISSEDHFEPSITGVLASSVSGPETGLKATLVAILDHVVPTKDQLAVWTTAPWFLYLPSLCLNSFECNPNRELVSESVFDSFPTLP